MSERRKPFLVADAAEVTVMRSLASTAFGAYSLDLPDGVGLEDVWEPAAPGNTPGYVASLGADERVGGMFRRFMRADVTITVPGDDPELRAGASDVEQVLDEARDRTAGEFFLESDITLAGLGPWVPLQDFVVGDIVDVSVWGAVVPMPVTRIEPVITDHSVTDWVVHVGGQLVADDVARVAENEAIYRALLESRRGIMGLEVTGRQVARAVGVAQSTADTARDEAQHLRDTLAGAGATEVDVASQLEDLNAQLQARGEGAPGGLIPAYIAANTQRWRLQDYTNELLAWQVQALQEISEWNQLHAPYAIASKLGEYRDAFVRTSGESELRIQNLTSDVRLEVAVGMNVEDGLSRNAFRVQRLSIAPGKSVVLSTGFWNPNADALVFVDPVPLSPFTPSAPPNPPN